MTANELIGVWLAGAQGAAGSLGEWIRDQTVTGKVVRRYIGGVSTS